jgi:fructose-1,6-bisphosphatase II / sedoheptulose-1,7-bisphosphatase
LRELIKGDTIFCATGITTSDFINGIIFDQEKVSTETLVTHKSSNFKKLIQSTNKINE